MCVLQIRDCWQGAMEQADYQSQCRAVAEFNSSNRWRKRGLSVTPVKFGVFPIEKAHLGCKVSTSPKFTLIRPLSIIGLNLKKSGLYKDIKL